MNFPTRHPLNQSSRRGAVVANADVIMGLEATDFWSALNTMHDQVHRTSRPIMKSDAKLISISTGDLYTKANYQDFYRYTEVDLAMAADAEATLPVADRGNQAPDHGGSQASLAGSRRQAGGGARQSAGAGANRRDLRLGRESRQHGAPVRRAVGADQERRLVARVDSQALQLVAAAAVALRQALPVHRHAGRRRASATTLPPRWARRSPTRSMAACRSAFRTMAI